MPESTGPPQDIAGTLPNDFKLSNTKAESKGEDHQEIFVSRSPLLSRIKTDVLNRFLQAHDVDTPENKPSFARQANDSSKVPNGPAM